MKRLAFALCALVACGGDDDVATIDRLVIDYPDAAALPDAPPPPDASLNPEECNATTQNCQDPVVNKCTVICTSPSTCETECLTPTGSLAESDACMRETNDTAGIGHDPCAAGLFCSGIGLPPGPPPERACRKFCDSDLNCMLTGQKCTSLDGTGPLQGICVPTCSLFGTDCTTNMSCSIAINNNGADGLGTCRANGTKSAGNACAAHSECLPNMNCISDGMGGGVCSNLCDNAHSCPAGQACTAVSPLPNGGGFCQ